MIIDYNNFIVKINTTYCGDKKMKVVIRNSGRRIIALVLALTVFAPTILCCGCRTKGSPSKVTEDMPWYDVIHFDVNDDFDSDEYLYAEYQLLGVKEEKIYVKAYAELLDDDIELQQDREEYWFLTYDTEGNLLSKTMFLDLLKDRFPLEEGRTRYIRIVNYDGEKISIAFDDDDEDYNAVSHTVLYDPADGTIIETENIDQELFCETDYKYSVIDGYSVKASQILGATGSSISLTVTDPDGQITVIDMSEEFPTMRLMLCQFIFKRNDGEAFIGISNGGLNNKYFSLDLSSKQITEVREPQDFIEAAYYFDGRYIEGIGNVVPNNKGIDVIDLKNESIENFFDINNCNMNRYASSLIEVNDVT